MNSIGHPSPQIRRRQRVLKNAFATATVALMLALYIYSTPHSVAFWDTGEMQTVPYILGIAHPTAFPLYVLLGWLFSHAVAFGTVAWRMNVFSAVSVVAASVALIIAINELGYQIRIAMPAALLFAVGETVWTHAIRADVHTLALCFEAFSFALLLRWNSRGDINALYAGALLLGCALATHPVAIWSIPALIVLGALGVRGLSPRAIIISVLLAGAPLLTYAYLPLRSAQLFRDRVDPTLALGLPPGRPFWDYGHPETLRALWWMISGAQFSKTRALLSFLEPLRYPSIFRIFLVDVARNTGVLAIPLASLGTLFSFRRRPSGGLALVLATLAPVPFALSYTIEADKESYLLFSFWALTILVAIGVAELANALRRIRISPSTMGGVALLALASSSLWANRGTLQQRNDVSGDLYVSRILRDTPKDAIIVAPWVLATPLGYAAYVEHRTAQRIIVVQDVTPKDAATLSAWMGKQPVYLIVEKAPVLKGICQERVMGPSPMLLHLMSCAS
ncbi:MAG: protein O-mannosyl-transferase family [Vulcanimicrobiaceae bacterium]